MNSKSTGNPFEQVIRILSFSYVLLVISGLGYNYYFYRQFGINITGYIDFVEALILFIPVMGEVLLFPLLYFLLWIAYLIKSIIHFDETARRPKLFGEKKDLVNGIMVMFWAFLAVTVALFILKLTSSRYNEAFNWMLLFLICFCIPFLIELFIDKLKFDVHIAYRFALYAILISITVVLTRAPSKAYRFKRKRDFQHFELKHNNPNFSFKNDSTLQLLGRTRNYIFIYNFKDSGTLIYNVSDVESFKIYPEGASAQLQTTKFDTAVNDSVPIVLTPAALSKDSVIPEDTIKKPIDTTIQKSKTKK